MLDIPEIYQKRLKEVYNYFNQKQFDIYEINIINIKLLLVKIVIHFF